MNIGVLSAMMTGIGCLCAFGTNAAASSLIYNQAQWQALASGYGTNALTTINLTTATYVNIVQPYAIYGGSDLTQSMNAPFEVTFQDQFVPPQSSPFATVGGGSVTAFLAGDNSLFISFGVPVYSFGGIFNIPIAMNSLDNQVVAGIWQFQPSGIISVLTPGFDGFVSDTPFTEVLIYAESCSYIGPCGNHISISDIQVSTIPTPEPATFALVGIAAAFTFLRRRFKTGTAAY